MREIASQRTTKPPTAENVSTLQILGMLDTITPTQMRLYAEQMSDCPLAMLRLGQIASAHNLKLVVSDPDALLKAVDILEDNGADIVSISQKLGHSEVSTTLNIYAHENEEAKERASQVLNDVLYVKKA